MSISKEKQNEIKSAIENEPKKRPAQLAEELSVSERDVVACFAEDIATEAPISDFNEVWGVMAEWEKATAIVYNSGIIAEMSGKLSKGKEGHGYFNLFDKDAPLNGHIKINNLGYMYLVSQPFMNMESHSVQFFDKEGKQVFGIYVGRDKKRVLLADVVSSFMDLKEKYKA